MKAFYKLDSMAQVDDVNFKSISKNYLLLMRIHVDLATTENLAFQREESFLHPKLSGR